MRLRPHIKTHKIAWSRAAAARRRRVRNRGRQGRRGRSVRAAGFDDIVIAYPVIGASKWRAGSRSSRAWRMIAVNVDSLTAAEGSAPRPLRRRLDRLQIDIDTGFGRCGVPIDDLGAIEELARLAACPSRA